MADRMANYEPVQARLARFWADHELGRVDCELLEHDTQHVLARASIWRVITDPFPAAVGYAAELHDGSPVNRQGWMIENAETSAIGRALANLGYAPSGARPSAEDMERSATRDAASRRQDLADAALAQVAREAGSYTFDRLQEHAGTPLADELKAFAKERGKSLGKKYLQTYPEWRAEVDARYLELIEGEQ